jgi:hypothetical protein
MLRVHLSASIPVVVMVRGVVRVLDDRPVVVRGVVALPTHCSLRSALAGDVRASCANTAMEPESEPPDDPSPVDIGKSPVLTVASVSIGTRSTVEVETLGARWTGRPACAPSVPLQRGFRGDEVVRGSQSGTTSPIKIKGMAGKGASCLRSSIPPYRVRIPLWATNLKEPSSPSAWES